MAHDYEASTRDDADRLGRSPARSCTAEVWQCRGSIPAPDQEPPGSGPDDLAVHHRDQLVTYKWSSRLVDRNSRRLCATRGVGNHWSDELQRSLRKHPSVNHGSCDSGATTVLGPKSIRRQQMHASATTMQRPSVHLRPGKCGWLALGGEIPEPALSGIGHLRVDQHAMVACLGEGSWECIWTSWSSIRQTKQSRRRSVFRQLHLSW